jgi:sarcosine oxidase subunit beta
MKTIEVGIIGAGIHGVSAAYHLARDGVQTRIFDKGAPASGPTGRSSAVCRAYYTNEFMAKVARDSLKMLAEFEELTSHDIGFRKTGFLFLHPKDQLAHVHGSAQVLNRLGTRIQLLQPTELATEFREIQLDHVGIAAWEPDAGYADPVSTTNGLFIEATKLGLEASLHTSVTAISPRLGGGALLTTHDRVRYECERLLLASGPWTRSLSSKLGVGLPLTVERHFVGAFGWGNAKPLAFGHADLIGGYYMRPERADLFLIGPLTPEAQVNPDDFDESIQADEVHGMASALLRRVPTMAAAESRGGWASLYDVSPDWQPVIGEVAEGVFVDAGTSGHGFKLAPAQGSYIASMVVGRSDFGLKQFHPSRFEQGLALNSGFGSARILG